MYEDKYQYQYLEYYSDALTAPCMLIGLQVWYADCSVYATCNKCIVSAWQMQDCLIGDVRML